MTIADSYASAGAGRMSGEVYGAGEVITAD